jgi:hypothetical protein
MHPDAADRAEFRTKIAVIKALSMSARRQIYTVIRGDHTTYHTMIPAIGMTLGEICSILVLGDQV